MKIYPDVCYRCAACNYALDRVGDVLSCRTCKVSIRRHDIVDVPEVAYVEGKTFHFATADEVLKAIKSGHPLITELTQKSLGPS